MPASLSRIIHHSSSSSSYYYYYCSVFLVLMTNGVNTKSNVIKDKDKQNGLKKIILVLSFTQHTALFLGSKREI